MIIGTADQRRKLKSDNDTQLQITVSENVIIESRSEKLLVLIVNNELTWHEYLYGEKW